MQASILIANQDQRLRQVHQQAFEQAGFIVHPANAPLDALYTALQAQPEVVLLGTGSEPGLAVETRSRLRQGAITAEAILIILTPREDLDIKLAAFAVGADDCVATTIDVRELVARVLAMLNRLRRAGASAAEQQGKIISFMAAKGGVGTTTVCVNTAAALALVQPRPVATVDLALPVGYRAHMLGLDGARNIADALGEGFAEPGGGRGLKRHFVGQDRLGFGVLPGARAPHEAREIQSADLVGLTERLRDENVYTLLDLGHAPSDACSPILRQSDRVVVVAPELVSVAVSKACINSLADEGLDRGRIDLVVSVQSTRGSMGRQEVEDKMGMEVRGFIPREGEIFASACDAGLPLVRKDPYCTASMRITDFARSLLHGGIWPVVASRPACTLVAPAVAGSSRPGTIPSLAWGAA